MTDTRKDDSIARVIHALEHDKALFGPAIQNLGDQIPAYQIVPREQLVASAHRNLALACRILEARKVPPVEQIWQAEKTTVERLRSGVPIEDIMAGFRVSISTIQERLVELADEHEVDGADLAAMTTLLWKLSDAFSARAAAAYRQQGLALAVADQRRRDEWLSGLLAGALAPGQVEQGRVAYRLRADASYRAFRTGPSDHESLVRAQQELAQQQGGEGGAMMAPTEGQLVGIVAGMPTPVAGHLVAVGPPEALDGLAKSNAIAQDVLTAAQLHFAEGVHTLDGLGWRVAVPTAAGVTDLLRNRYLDPLRGAGAFGEEIILALRSYLSYDRSIPQTAAALHVHVNTLRYRLARFEELTGRSLQATDTIVELAWALYPEPPVS